MLGQLIPVGGGDPIPLLKPNLMVGRRPSCDIRLEYANVSSHHCRLDYINGYWRASDISRNGTKVNGDRIDEKFLQPGDTVSFARHAFEIQYTPDPNAIPPVEEEVDPFEISLLEKAGLTHDRHHRKKDHSPGGKPGQSTSDNSGRPVDGSPNNSPRRPLRHDDDDIINWLKD